MSNLDPAPNSSGNKIIQITQLIIATTALLNSIHQLISFLHPFHG
jgi:hypothetical protein